MSVGLPFPFRVDSYPVREDILLVLWDQEAWNIEQFRPAALVHWSFNIFLSFFLPSVWTGFEIQKFQPAALIG